MEPPRIQAESIDRIATQIRDGQIKRIVVIAGAGLSTSAGYPDFRSPKAGIYDKISRIKALPFPEAIFSVHYFKHTPEPFFAFYRGLMQLKFKPTITHAFLALLQRMGVLEMVFTQNIDGLERAAGIPDEKVIPVHGQIGSQRCMTCKVAWSTEKFERVVQSGQVPRCDNADCNNSLVKPDTVMFGEMLPARFAENTEILKFADLVLVIGTSLKVHPVAILPSLATPGVPRVLINKEKAGDLGSRPEDILLLGDCDHTVRLLADALGLREELEDLWKEIGPQPGDESPKMEDALDIEIEKLINEHMKENMIMSKGHKAFLEKHLEDKMSQIGSDSLE
jgi:NAD+-dependent protein deacetylase SIR2